MKRVTGFHLKAMAITQFGYIQYENYKKDMKKGMNSLDDGERHKAITTAESIIRYGESKGVFCGYPQGGGRLLLKIMLTE
jgi:hypothetical protein